MVRDYDTSVLRDLVVKHFSRDELHRLCQGLRIEYNDLPGESRASKAGELVGYFERCGRIPELVDTLRKCRSHVPWKEALKKEDDALNMISSPVVVILPVVVVTMTRNEATKLRKNSTQMILQLIESTGGHDFIERYDEQHRDKWYPFGKHQGTIQEVIYEFAEKIEISENGKSFQIEFESHSEDFFSNNAAVPTWVLEKLADDGCLFIVDGISLFHPEILARFQQAISGREPRALFFITPTNLRQLEFSKLLERRIRKFYPQFFIDHDSKLSPHRGFLIGNGTELHRSLKTCLKELRPTKRIPSSWEKQYWRAGIPAPGIGREFQYMP